jgi:hypothetical protein
MVGINVWSENYPDPDVEVSVDGLKLRPSLQIHVDISVVVSLINSNRYNQAAAVMNVNP